MHKKLNLTILLITIVIHTRLLQAAISYNNWSGLIFSSTHVLLVALVARWGILQAITSKDSTSDNLNNNQQSK